MKPKAIPIERRRQMQLQRYKEQNEALAKAKILLEREGVYEPSEKEFDSLPAFFDADKAYREKKNYYYVEILNGRMQLL